MDMCTLECGRATRWPPQGAMADEGRSSTLLDGWRLAAGGWRLEHGAWRLAAPAAARWHQSVPMAARGCLVAAPAGTCGRCQLLTDGC